MATLYTSGSVLGNSAFKPSPQGNMGVRSATFAAGALVVNDVIQMCDVFKGETVVGVVITTTDLDTGGSPAIVLDTGYGGATAALIDGSTIGQAGGTASSFAVGNATHGSAAVSPVVFAADDTIDILVQVAPQTTAAGTITMYLFVA